MVPPPNQASPSPSGGDRRTSPGVDQLEGERVVSIAALGTDEARGSRGGPLRGRSRHADDQGVLVRIRRSEVDDLAARHPVRVGEGPAAAHLVDAVWCVGADPDVAAAVDGDAADQAVMSARQIRLPFPPVFPPHHESRLDAVMGERVERAEHAAPVGVIRPAAGIQVGKPGLSGFPIG